MTNCSVIVAILQENRVETAPKVQDVLTEYGCHIRVRLGLHDAALDACTNTGLILLQMCGDKIPVKEMEAKLSGQDFVRVHRKYIIRLDKIKASEDDSAVIEKAGSNNSGHMMNGFMYVPIGSSYKTSLMQRLNLI